MSKKVLLIVLSLALIIPAFAVEKVKADRPIMNGNRDQVITPSGRQVPQNIQKILRTSTPAARDPQGLEVVPLDRPTQASNNESVRDDLLWKLQHVDDNAEYYLGSGAAADTFATVFTPAAPAVVKEVYTQWYTAGNINAFGADYSDAAYALSPDGDCADIARGDFDGSPIGALRTTITPNTIEGYAADWSTQLDIGGEFIVGDSTDLGNVPPFVIAFVKGGETPNPLANDVMGGPTYTWFGGPWTEGQWGRYSNVTDVAHQVWVTYPWGAPIAIQTLDQLNNTFATSGPFTVVTDLFDDVGENDMAIDENDVINYNYSVNGGDAITGVVTAVDVGADGNGFYSFDIAGTYMVGDVIEYWITATDNDGLASESIHLSFEILEPAQPDADLLIVLDSKNDSQLDAYEYMCDVNGIVYEVWDASLNFGIDASVINYGWENIIVYGWGTKTVPALGTEVDPGYGAFLDNGGTLILSDQDWYFGHGLPAQVTFNAGDFAYDYFGIGSGENDPADADGNSTADTTFFGIGGTPIDSPFASEAMLLEHVFLGTLNWGDYVTPALATPLFAGANDGNTYGVAYDNGTFKTAYFGMMPDAAITGMSAPDTAEDESLIWDYTELPATQFGAFANGVFEWMSPGTPPQISGVSGPGGTVLAGPYAVEATIIHADDAAIAASVYWSADGEVWSEIAMTDDGAGVFSADIPNVDESGMYYWFIEATADGRTSTYPDAAAGAAMFERFAPTSPTLVLFNGWSDDYDIGTYPGPYYFGMVADFTYDVWTKGLTADLASAYTTIFEIMTNGPVYDNTAVVQAWLGEGEKNYMLAGDEYGAFYGWADGAFEAGSFEYDVLGISYLHNDIIENGSTGADAIEAVDGNALSGGLYTTHTTAGDTLMYDPYYEVGVSNWLDGFTPVDPASVAFTTWGRDTTYTVGLHHMPGDDNVIFLGFDPLSINAAPYTWYGFSLDAPQAVAVGLWDLVGVEDQLVNLPTEFSLGQAYPNPFNPTTTIAFEVPEARNVTLSVYNMLGQKVVDLVDRSFAPGVYNVQWNGLDANGKQMGSGLYIYHMTAGDYTATSKMLLLK